MFQIIFVMIKFLIVIAEASIVAYKSHTEGFNREPQHHAW